MPRALLSVSDKTGLLPFAQALAARGYELVSTGGTARALETAGVPVTGISAVTGFPGNHGRPRQDAASGGARRHPRPPRACRRHDDPWAAQHHPHRPRRRQPVSVREGRGDARHRLRRARSKRSISAAPAWCGRPRRTSRTCSSSSIRRTTRACIAELERPGGASPEFRFELARKAFAHTAAYDTAIAGTLAEFDAA